MPAGDCIVVGKLGSPYGVRGWLHVKSFTSPADNLLNYSPWALSRGGNEWQPVVLEGCRAHKSGFVAKFEGVDDRDAAATLTATLVGVARQSLPEAAADEFYWRDMEGCAVVDRTGAALGRVHGFLETGAHDVMVVQGAAGDETLVPFAARYVTEVDLEARRIVVDWQSDW